MKVKPSLFLNMSPQTIEDCSLAFARNMKLDDDGNLISDYGYKDISSMANYNIVGHIVGLDNKIYFFTATGSGSSWSNSKIVEYDELTENITPLTTAWTYSGGEIDGYVSTNQSGEKILTIGEYIEGGSNIPLKHINLKYANVRDESLYCQAPKVPIANISLYKTYIKTIPNGVYVFFIRYEIRKNVYTNWYLCSRPIFGGCCENITTLQGGLKYINLHKDSAKSFILNIDFANSNAINLYSAFQIGFIITHDEATDARIWKSFSMNTSTIYFDYEDVQETDIDNLLETTYEIYNVRNITSFKNKLYIGNYIETNFNPTDINSDLLSAITLSVEQKGSAVDYKNMKINGTSLKYNYSKGYYDSLANNSSIKQCINSNLFDFNVSNLVKVDTTELNKAATFELFWDNNNDPDIAFIHNIRNYLVNKGVFGNDFLKTIDFNNLPNLGITKADEGENIIIYRLSTSPHPWYKLSIGLSKDKQLTFAYSSVYDSSKYSSGTENWRFNYHSYIYEPVRKSGGSVDGWPARNNGFTSAACRGDIINNIKKEVKNKSFFGKCYIEVNSGAKTYKLGYSNNMDLDNYVMQHIDSDGKSVTDIDTSDSQGYNLATFDLGYANTGTINTNLASSIKIWTYNIIYDKIVGIDESGAPILNIDGEDIIVSNINVIFKKFEFDIETNELESDGESRIVTDFTVSLKTTTYRSLCSFALKSSAVSLTDYSDSTDQASTLMPLSTYDAYIHFVDEYGIITNGKLLRSSIAVPANATNRSIIELRYNIGTIPSSRYKAFFISLVNTGAIIVECFNYRKKGNTQIVNCLEIDSLLYNINDNITIIDSNGTIISPSAKYYSSGSTYPPLAFGNCGYISWNSSSDYSSSKLYIRIARNTHNENNKILTKASNYIPLISGTSAVLPGGFYGSYFCLVKKPSFELSSNCYVSGSDVYSINRDVALSLTEFKNYIQVQNSVTYFVRSNFNLNYLSLTEDINDKIFTAGSASSGVKQVAKVINSAILSFIYELKSMYKDFMNKTFKEYDTEYKIDFDNTIRVSNVLSDETFNNSIFKFRAIDYYNVPTDRGIIVNIFSIGNNIFVHTKDSFYKFDANQTIATSDSDITLQESEPFNAGISQIFDSEYGYGGIQNKQAGCVTFDSYFFYDQTSNHIFGYAGNQQVKIIDGNIYKLLSYYKPSDCKTLHDELNCRVLFEFTSSRSEHNSQTYKTFTLSYNYKTKTFVSFHDLSLVNAFSSKHKAYSYKSNLLELFNTNGDINTNVLVTRLKINKIFGNATTASIIQFGADADNYKYRKHESQFSIAVVYALKQDIKESLDSVRYVADIQKNTVEYQTTNYYDLMLFPPTTRINPVIKFYAITDRCVSSIVTTNVNDEARPNSLLDYKGFKYDMGFWTSNYFRNNINKSDIYNYGQKYNRDLDVDQNSLVYGRYFILVFEFKNDTPIKFEEIFVNSIKY